MTENLGRRLETERSAERRRTLVGRLDRIAQRSRHMGVDLAYLVADQNVIPIAARNESQPIFAASTGKLPLALMVLENFDYDHEIDRDLEKMLALSDNDSYARLAEMLGGPAKIQEYYSQWRHTSVYRAENGKTEIGETTPAEAVLQMRLLLGQRPNTDLFFERTVKDSLLNNEVYNHGIRQVVVDNHPDIRVWNKTGEYNGDMGVEYAAQTPYSVRSDVGAVNTMHGQDFLFYSFMAKGPEGKVGGWLGDQVISLATAEVLVAMGHHDYLKFGAKAMRFAGVRLPLARRAIA